MEIEGIMMFGKILLSVSVVGLLAACSTSPSNLEEKPERVRSFKGQVDYLSEKTSRSYYYSLAQYGSLSNKFGRKDGTFLPSSGHQDCSLTRREFLDQDSKWIVKHTRREERSHAGLSLKRMRFFLEREAKRFDKSVENGDNQYSHLLVGESLSDNYPKGSEADVRQRKELTLLLANYQKELSEKHYDDPLEVLDAAKLSFVNRFLCEWDEEVYKPANNPVTAP